MLSKIMSNLSVMTPKSFNNGIVGAYLFTFKKFLFKIVSAHKFSEPKYKGGKIYVDSAHSNCIF
jgi:hypothetical protein